jgi:hypothetical protein
VAATDPAVDETFVTPRGQLIHFSHACLKEAFRRGLRLLLYNSNPERLSFVLSKLFTEPIENPHTTFTARQNRLAVPIELLQVLQQKVDQLYKAFPTVFPRSSFQYCFRAVRTVYRNPKADRDFLDQIVLAHYRSLKEAEAADFARQLFADPLIGGHFQKVLEADKPPCGPMLAGTQ